MEKDYQITPDVVLVSGPLRGPWRDFNFLCLTVTFFLHRVGCPLWREDGSVICSAISHWLDSRRAHKHILLSHLKLSQPGGPGPRMYISQEKTGPVIPWVLGSLFVAFNDSQGYGGGILTRLHTGWGNLVKADASWYTASARTAKKTSLQQLFQSRVHTLRSDDSAAVSHLRSCCLATAVLSLFVSRSLPSKG
jgi:hypothetical protein